MKYTVDFDIIASYSFDVEADDVEKAIELAEAIPISVVGEDGELVGYIAECNVFHVVDEAGNVVDGDPYL